MRAFVCYCLDYLDNKKTNEKTIDKSGVEKIIKKLIQTPNHFEKFFRTLDNALHSYPKILNEFSNKYIAYKKYPDDNNNKNDFFS